MIVGKFTDYRRGVQMIVGGLRMIVGRSTDDRRGGLPMIVGAFTDVRRESTEGATD